MPAQREQKATKAGECRQCATFCDKLVEPRGCLELRCSYLYSYDDEVNGKRYMGCMQKVFKGEIDVEAFELAELTGGGFGGLKMASDPLPQCQFHIEPAFEGGGAGHECVNPGFFDGGLQIFDLRDSLT